MESLKSYLNRRINSVLDCGLMENVIVDCIIVTEEVNRHLDTTDLIFEAGVLFNPIPGVKHHTYRIDKQLGDGGPGRQRHIHIFYNGNEMLAMNVDATAHDGYHQVKIPDEIVSFLKGKGFKIPDNHIIEMMVQPSADKELICEEFNYEALNSFAMTVGETIRKASIISIIEANVETYQIICHSKVASRYQLVDQLEDVPQCQIYEIKQMLIDLLQNMGKFGESLDIFDDNLTAPHKLFVAYT